MIYNMLISGVQHSDSVIYVYFGFFSPTGYYKILSIVPVLGNSVLVVCSDVYWYQPANSALSSNFSDF